MKGRIIYRISLIVLLFFEISFSTRAQDVRREISGSVIDSVTHSPLFGTSLTILKESDSSLITGIYSDDQGNFHLSFSSGDEVLIKISYLGYQVKFIPVRFHENQNHIHLKRISLVPFKNTLQQVTITAEKEPMYEFKKDTTLFNVPDNFMPGGMAMDVLEYTPEITFDANNNILVKGQGNVGVYVDNRPIALTGMDVQTYLENTPSFMIEQIQILKTPPDPEDAAQALAAGITDRYYINIITRKIRYKGYNAGITAGANTRNELTGRLRFNLNLSPFKLNYFNNLRNNTDSSYLRRISFFGSGDSSFLDQKNFSSNLYFSQNLNASYEFKFSEKERLRLDARGGWSQNSSSATNISTIDNPKNITDQNRIQQSNSHSTGYNINANADYLKDYDKEGKELHATVQFNKGTNQNHAMSVGQYLSSHDTLNQLNEGLGNQMNLRNNIQYKNTFGNEKYYLLDGSMNFSQNHNLNDVSRSDTSSHSSDMYHIDELSTDFNSNLSDFNVLGLMGKKDQKLGWVAAISAGYYLQNGADRFQLSNYNNEAFVSHNAIGMNFSPGKNQQVNINFNPAFESYVQQTQANDSVPVLTYQYNNFMPGASVKYSLGDHEISLNYHRDIELPSWKQLNPYINNLDPLNIHTGNPDLRPSFTNQYHFRYEYNHQAIYAGIDLRKSISKDVISGYTTVDSNGVSTSTYVNLNSRQSENAGLNAGFHYFKNIPSLKGNVNINMDGGIEAYHLESDDPHVSPDFRNVTGFSSHAKLWTSLRMGFISLDVYGNYVGPRYFAQGKRPSQFTSGLRTRADLLHRRLNISFGIENLFGATIKDNYFKTDQYIQYSSNRKNVRYFSIYITYNVRKFKKSHGSDERNESNNKPNPSGGKYSPRKGGI